MGPRPRSGLEDFLAAVGVAGVTNISTGQSPSAKDFGGMDLTSRHHWNDGECIAGESFPNGRMITASLRSVNYQHSQIIKLGCENWDTLVLMKLSWCIHTIRIYPVSSPPGEGMTQHVESRISQGLSTSMCLCCFEILVSSNYPISASVSLFPGNAVTGT